MFLQFIPNSSAPDWSAPKPSSYSTPILEHSLWEVERAGHTHKQLRPEDYQNPPGVELFQLHEHCSPLLSTCLGLLSQENTDRAVQLSLGTLDGSIRRERAVAIGDVVVRVNGVVAKVHDVANAIGIRLYGG